MDDKSHDGAHRAHALIDRLASLDANGLTNGLIERARKGLEGLVNGAWRDALKAEYRRLRKSAVPGIGVSVDTMLRNLRQRDEQLVAGVTLEQAEAFLFEELGFESGPDQSGNN